MTSEPGKQLKFSGIQKQSTIDFSSQVARAAEATTGGVL